MRDLVKPTAFQKRRAERFSKEVLETNLEAYKKRKQFDPKKIQQDIYLGKLAEYAVFNSIDGCNPPDVNIYKAKDKSFDADLSCGMNDVHVKSCLIDSPYGHSWVFEPYDELTFKPDDYEYVALCVIDQEGQGEYELITSIKAVSLYRPPKLRHLNKKVIYKEDLNKVSFFDY